MCIRDSVKADRTPPGRFAGTFGGCRARLVLDLQALRRIDSSGLSALLSVLKAARAAGGDVVLLSPSATVASILRLTRLDQILEAYDDEGTALARLWA